MITDIILCAAIYGKMVKPTEYFSVDDNEIPANMRIFSTKMAVRRKLLSEIINIRDDSLQLSLVVSPCHGTSWILLCSIWQRVNKVKFLSFSLVPGILHLHHWALGKSLNKLGLTFFIISTFIRFWRFYFSIENVFTSMIHTLAPWRPLAMWV